MSGFPNCFECSCPIGGLLHVIQPSLLGIALPKTAKPGPGIIVHRLGV